MKMGMERQITTRRFANFAENVFAALRAFWKAAFDVLTHFFIADWIARREFLLQSTLVFGFVDLPKKAVASCLRSARLRADEVIWNHPERDESNDRDHENPFPTPRCFRFV